MPESKQGRGGLHYCVGLPRSGKSTWCDRWVREVLSKPFKVDWQPAEFLECGDRLKFKVGDIKPCEPTPPPRARVVIAGDDFRTALHGNAFRVEAEGTVFAMMDVAARALLDRGFDVIVDETCTTEQTLLRYLRLDPNATPVFIDTPEEVCVERALASNKPFLVGPIRRMASQLSGLRDNWDQTVARLKAYLDHRKAQDIPC
jgi:predicted kinase